MELREDSENLGNSKHMKVSEEKGEGGCAQMGKMGPCATWCLAPISSYYCCPLLQIKNAHKIKSQNILKPTTLCQEVKKTQMGKMGRCATWCLAPISSCPCCCCCWGWSTSFPQDSHFETNHTVPRSEKNSIQLILRSVLGSKSTFLYNCQWHRNWSLQLFFLFLFRLPRSNCIFATTRLGICCKLCNVFCCIHT